MPIVIDQKLKVREVKNLRWLIDNSSTILEFHVAITHYRHIPFPEAYLIAKTSTGKWYITTFQSLEILLEWLCRRTFYDLPVNIGCGKYVIRPKCKTFRWKY